MKVGDLTNFGLILEIKDNPADLSTSFYKCPRKIALVLPYGGGESTWYWMTLLRQVLNDEK